ncbi:Periplasmic thiol:disulfide interchange protein DsbA [hydrothermal vent metagenome]|uniref:Periplasmic thiol:disulfide interchange protein DsbA n=1 Tax=hydrothermal vent metagenome TaxID=652676 RepID=A0A3B0RCQ7_9ZZZZ
MLFSALAFRPAYFVIGAAALALAACGGASSDEAADSAGAETIDESATGAFAEMTRGKADAVVTVIEYASVTCPHCATFHEQVYPTIKENYIDTGKVRFVFREFPTSPANLSIAGSMLARCAADTGGMDAYFLVLDTLFKTQGDPRQRTGWIYSENPREELIKIAAQAGMGEDDLDACINREELLDFLNENVKTGRDKYDIRSTPSFVVNGTVRHFSSVEDMSAALDEAIEKAGE